MRLFGEPAGDGPATFHRAYRVLGPPTRDSGGSVLGLMLPSRFEERPLFGVGARESAVAAVRRRMAARDRLFGPGAPFGGRP